MQFPPEFEIKPSIVNLKKYWIKIPRTFKVIYCTSYLESIQCTNVGQCIIKPHCIDIFYLQEKFSYKNVDISYCWKKSLFLR